MKYLKFAFYASISILFGIILVVNAVYSFGGYIKIHQDSILAEKGDITICNSLDSNIYVQILYQDGDEFRIQRFLHQNRSDYFVKIDTLGCFTGYINFYRAEKVAVYDFRKNFIGNADLKRGQHIIDLKDNSIIDGPVEINYFFEYWQTFIYLIEVLLFIMIIKLSANKIRFLALIALPMFVLNFYQILNIIELYCIF